MPVCRALQLRDSGGFAPPSPPIDPDGQTTLEFRFVVSSYFDLVNSIIGLRTLTPNPVRTLSKRMAEKQCSAPVPDTALLRFRWNQGHPRRSADRVFVDDQAGLEHFSQFCLGHHFIGLSRRDPLARLQQQYAGREFSGKV